MIRILAALLAIALVTPSFGATTAQKAAASASCPASVRIAGVCPTSSTNFATSQYWVKGPGYVPVTSLISTTRAQTVTSYATDSSGLLIPFAANTPRITSLGLLVEEARTNSLLRSRDMTNASWVKVGMGTALNATGADGTANSATTLTATGTASSCTASCTALQTLVLGSAADTYSVYLKRVTGTGTVNVTINNLVGTTPCTLNSVTFTRCTVTNTLANPVVGVQLTVLNDVVVADFNQIEAGAFVTSPIPTTTVAVARAGDVIAMQGTLKTLTNAAQGSLVTYAAGTPRVGLGNAVIIDGTTTYTLLFVPNSSSSVRTTDVAATLGSGATTGPTKAAMSWDAGGQSAVGNNGTVATTATQKTATSTPGVGSYNGGASLFYDGYISRLTVWNSRLPDATLKAATQ